MDLLGLLQLHLLFIHGMMQTAVLRQPFVLTHILMQNSRLTYIFFG